MEMKLTKEELYSILESRWDSKPSTTTHVDLLINWADSIKEVLLEIRKSKEDTYTGNSTTFPDLTINPDHSKLGDEHVPSVVGFGSKGETVTDISNFGKIDNKSPLSSLSTYAANVIVSTNKLGKIEHTSELTAPIIINNYKIDSKDSKIIIEFLNDCIKKNKS